MPADQLFPGADAFAAELRQLHSRRKSLVFNGRKFGNRRVLRTRSDREAVLAKTGGRCHICGGDIDKADWQADHVLAASTGGKHSVENYLPAHSICNNYRWHYTAEEFQWILKLGVWVRTQVENQTTLGRQIAENFCGHERRRDKRRKST